MSEKIIPFEIFEEAKKRKERKKEDEKLLKIAEQKEGELISVEINLRDILDVQFLNIKDFFGEKHIIYNYYNDEYSKTIKIDIPEITYGDVQGLNEFLKKKNIKYEINKIEK